MKSEEIKEVLALYNNKAKMRKEEAKKYSKLIYDIYDIVDKDTGAVFLSDDDSILLKRQRDVHPLFKVFDIECTSDKRVYTCNMNNRVILRGAKNYYYGFCFLGDLNVTNEEILNTLKYTNIFINEVIKQPIKGMRYNSILDLKYILAILDVMRNSCITNLFFFLMKENKIEDIYIYNDKENETIDGIYKLLLKIEEKLVDIILEQKNSLSFGVWEILNEFIRIQTYIENIIKNNKKDYEKDLYIRYRKLREADNVVENILSINYAIKCTEKNKLKDLSNNEIYVFGLNYGSVELAIIASIILSRNKVSVITGNIMKKFRKVYVEAANNQKNIINEKLKKDAQYIIIDENLMTGSTLNKANDYIQQCGLNLMDIIVIKYPTVARVKNLEGIDVEKYIKLMESVKGMIIPSNYSKLCNIRKDFIFPFMDNLGTFDLTKYEILKNLYKNKIYKNNSAVSRLEEYYKDVFF